MQESEIWITRLTNDHFAGFANSILGLVGIHSQPRPWADSMVMQLLVALILVVVFAILRMRLSADRPGKLQQTFELVYEFVQGQAQDQIGHAAKRYLSFFGTIFLFILACNLIGLIPCFRSEVRAGVRVRAGPGAGPDRACGQTVPFVLRHDLPFYPRV